MLVQMFEKAQIADSFHRDERIVVFGGDCIEFLKTIPDGTFQLVVPSPPYNLGKEYERRIHLDDYVEQQRRVIRECVRASKPAGSICWEVGNYVDAGHDHSTGRRAVSGISGTWPPVQKPDCLALRARVALQSEELE